ncbi:MAG: HEAT repeat domain-containing protein [Bryobacteraceae bacterium]
MCRAAACWAMSRTGDPVFLPHLKDMAKDSDSAVRGAAMTALVRLNRANQG